MGLGDWRIEEGLQPASDAQTAMVYLLDYVDGQFMSGSSHADSIKTWAALQY